jgi:hypothetical protein
MFMSAAEHLPPIAQETKPSRSGRLLAFVRRLIDYGKEVADTIRQRALADPAAVRRCFGTMDIALILARIACGLRRAQALEERVTRCATRLDTEPQRARGPSRARLSVSRPLAVPSDPLLASLPTAEQIAAEVRRRPVGAVVADICRDLGILPSHPLWPEVRQVITQYGGSLARLVSDLIDQAFAHDPRYLSPTGQRTSTACGDPPSGTGPPAD